MKRFILILLFSGSVFFVKSQVPYTTAQFAYDSLLNITYGTAVNYAGNTDTLMLDIYKPVGDSNCLRPLIILLHGGAWIGGSKEDYDMVAISREMAKRGWTVANMNYRLGTHKAANYVMYALCNTTISQPCGYICDSAEIFRANFRAMQDAKGAIRFMKNRHAIDSTDINNVFIAGESAGGFIAIAAGFTDNLSEKSQFCFSIADVPTPDTDMFTYGCIPSPNNLSRPDLGSIEGTLNTGSYNSTVKGVGNIFGGVTDLAVFQQTTDTPVVYLFHQGSDVVVHYNYDNILGRTSWECYAQTNLCQSYYFYPKAYGSEGIHQHFVSLGTASPLYHADIVSNYSYLNNCFSNGHSIDNFQLRLQNMVNLFANKIVQSGNNPQANCLNNNIDESISNNDIIIYPNPANSQIHIKVSSRSIGSVYTISDPIKKTVMIGKINIENTTIDIGHLHEGMYFFTIGGNSALTFKVIKQ